MQPNDGQNLWQTQEGEQTNTPPTQESEQTPPQGQIPSFEPVSWEAAEGGDHKRDGVWFAGFSIIVLTLLGISIWQQKWTFTALIIVMSIVLIAYIRRPLRTLRYSLSGSGLHIGDELHTFEEFRSFGIIEDESLFSIMLMPTKRFGQAVTIYFSEQEGEKIVDILGSYLPMEDIHLDIMDGLLRRLRL